AIGREAAGIADLLDATIGGQPSIGERSELLEVQVLRDLDHVACRNWNIFREPTIGPEARPAHVGADVRVADLAMATYAVAPSGGDHHMVAFQQACGFWNDAANLPYRAGDLVTRDYRRGDIAIVLEKSVDQENIRTAQPPRSPPAPPLAPPRVG